MKKSLILACAFALATSSAFAGGFSQPVIEPAIQEPAMPAEMVTQNSSSAAGVVVPILVVVALLIAAKNRGVF
jgi:hypothetical protein